MRTFWKIFYNLVVLPILLILVLGISIFKQKYRMGIKGRKKIFLNLKHKSKYIDNGKKRVWFHVSSLGEFEQAKPLILELKNLNNDIKIIVSFFSPSGYEPSKNFKFADLITYLPFDSIWNAKKFVKIINPNLAIFIRYDLWPNHIWELKKKKIPIVIANATMRRNTPRLYPVLKSFHRVLYNEIDYIATISEDDKKVFELLELSNPTIEIMGDTRYDQVFQRANESRKKHLISENIIKNKFVLIAGSTWEADEKVLLNVYKNLKRDFKNFLLIIVPHEPTIKNIIRIEDELNGEIPHIRFSELIDYKGEEVIIVDSIGNLMSLYQYATVAFVGGSFKGSVHNVLEPAVYGIPVILGPYHTNSQEAINLIRAGGAFSCQNENDVLEVLIRLFKNEDLRHEAGKIAGDFVNQNTGATNKFLSYVKKVL